MSSNTENKRIAKNTIVVYIRLIITTIIGLITSRIVLQTLGVSDYGLYNIVGGILTLFTIIATTLSGTTIRFLNYEIGKKNGNPNKVFNICNALHLIFSLIIFLLAETIGVFYILNYLNVEVGKEADAMFVFQVSTIISCIGVTNIPYRSVLIVKEKFTMIAIITIVNALIKLLLVCLLLYQDGNKLRIYSVYMGLLTLVSFLFYHYICYKNWYELVKWKFERRIKHYKDLLIYNNYNLLATFALLGRSQGSNILINFFFGTIVNGAYAIANTVQGFVVLITTSFDQAAAPQITQNVGSGNMERASYLAYTTCRYSQLLCLLAFFPLYVEIEFLLKLWLGIVPEHTVSFCRLILITIVVASTGGGFLRLKDAMGKIKWFMIVYSFWYLITLPLGYLLYKNGYPPETILILYIISDIMARLSQLTLMKIIYGFDVISFCRKAYPRPIIVLTIMSFYIMCYFRLQISGGMNHLFGLTATALCGGFIIIFIGMKKSERMQSLMYIQNKIKKRNCGLSHQN